MSYGLGKGFDNLIPTDLVDEEFDPTATEDAAESELVKLPINKVFPDEDQPRKKFSEEALAELSASIKEHGVLQPIVVSRDGDKYNIVAGERRWRAAKEAGLRKIPAIVRTVGVQQRLELSIIENAQREDLNAIELATAYAKLQTQFNLSYQQIGEKVGKNHATIRNYIRLLRLPDEAKRAMRDYNLMEGPMRQLVGADPELIHEILPKMIDGQWSARQVERYMSEHKKKSSSTAVKQNTYIKREDALSRKYSAKVRVRGRSVTLTCKTNEDLDWLLERLQKEA